MLRFAKHEDLDEIIDIHLKTLNTGLLAKLGKNYLKKVFYPSCIQSNDVLVLVYEINSKIISFVIYVKNGPSFTKFLLNKKIALFFSILKNIFFYPSLFKDILTVLKGFHIKFDKGYHVDVSLSAELYLIATDPLLQSTGIGKILLTQGIKELKNNFNISTCIVKTSSSRANKFYLANHFQLIGYEYRGKECFNVLLYTGV